MQRRCQRQSWNRWLFWSWPGWDGHHAISTGALESMSFLSRGSPALILFTSGDVHQDSTSLPDHLLSVLGGSTALWGWLGLHPHLSHLQCPSPCLGPSPSGTPISSWGNSKLHLATGSCWSPAALPGTRMWPYGVALLPGWAWLPPCSGLRTTAQSPQSPGAPSLSQIVTFLSAQET